MKKVIDPEFNLSVVDLGLIYQLDFDTINRIVYVTMTLTTRFCPIGELLASGVKRAVASIFPNDTIQLDITFSPAWTYERISEEAKTILTR